MGNLTAGGMLASPARRAGQASPQGVLHLPHQAATPKKPSEIKDLTRATLATPDLVDP